MPTYIIKRVLLMVPTFFIITLVIFGVLNFADPPSGAQGGEGNETAQSQEARESYRIFKEQFNFDKPIFFNTRFSLTEDEVASELRTIADYRRPVCEDTQNSDGCIGQDARPPVADAIESEEKVEDWGNYIVPHLLEIAKTDDRMDVRLLATQRLSVNAKRRLKNEYGRNQSEKDKAFNKEAYEENRMVSSWSPKRGTTEQELSALIADKWDPWFEEKKGRFDYSFGDKTWIFFTDTRFAKYWGNLARLDFGVSHVDKRPVLTKVMEKLPYTLSINFLAIFFAYIISVPLGVWSAYRQNTPADHVVTVILFLLYSLPNFFVAVLFLQYFTQGDGMLDLFPTGDFVGKFPEWYEPGRTIETTDDMTALEYLLSASYHLVLPTICLTYAALASLSRYARTGLLDVIRSDYIRTARAKGLSEPMVIIKHAVRNGMIPVLTLIGLLLPALIGGSIVIEFVFNIPGLGLFIFESISARDFNSIMGVLLISTVLTLIGLLLSDISYAIVDPRISFD